MSVTKFKEIFPAGAYQSAQELTWGGNPPDIFENNTSNGENLSISICIIQGRFYIFTIFTILKGDMSLVK